MLFRYLYLFNIVLSFAHPAYSADELFTLACLPREWILLIYTWNTPDLRTEIALLLLYFAGQQFLAAETGITADGYKLLASLDVPIGELLVGDHGSREIKKVVKAREFEAMLADINKLFSILEKVVLINLRGDVL
jgi:hypothetical protein